MKIFLQKIGPKLVIKKVFTIKKFKNTVMWAYVIGDIKGEEIVQNVTKRNYKNFNQNNLLQKN